MIKMLVTHNIYIYTHTTIFLKLFKKITRDDDYKMISLFSLTTTQNRNKKLMKVDRDFRNLKFKILNGCRMTETSKVGLNFTKWTTRIILKQAFGSVDWIIWKIIYVRNNCRVPFLCFKK